MIFLLIGCRRNLVIDLLTSYRNDRTTRVCVLGEYSKDHVLQCGVPHGSIAGPLIFTAYAQPVANIIRRFQIGYHIYADDTQLYVSFDPKSEEDIVTAKSRLTDSIAKIRSWMLANKLKLNDSKTELVLIASPRNASAMPNLELEIGESVITPSGSIKNLGIMFDNNLTMKDHVSLLCRTVNFHLRNLNRIRYYIDRSTCAHAVGSLILSRLDYSNSLLGALSSTDLDRLQKLQNRAARLIYQSISVARQLLLFVSCTGCLWSRELSLRSQCMCTTVYNGSSPVYLQDLISKYNSGRQGLRCNRDQTCLAIPNTKRAFGDKYFAVFGPKLWNSLPANLREAPSVQCFKKLFKNLPLSKRVGISLLLRRVKTLCCF